MQRVAILGANGFVGSRAVEMFHLQEEFEVRPVVRQFGSLVRSSRFNLDCKVADVMDTVALQSAFSECDVVVDLIAGNLDVIVESVASVYQSACAAGVRRLIYLSSASVHGQAPAPGTNEDSHITSAQPLPYNSAKVKAERRLLRQREGGSTEVVILRPGIVFGPRSRWTAGIADQILNGSAYLIGDGSGICNSIYVDNLVDAIRLSLKVPEADKQAFLVGDEATVTWADLYGSIANAFGVELSQIPHVKANEFHASLKDLASIARSSAPVQKILPLVPYQLKRSIKAALSALVEQPAKSAWSLPAPAPVSPTLEMTLLQQCRYKLPSNKAKSILGYEASISFEEGCRRSVGWLKFAGYPTTI